jgi:hypothetical protein
MIKINETTSGENKFGFGLQSIDISNFNYETPVLKFLRSFYKKDLKDHECYLFHNEITFNKKDNFIFILKDDVLLTSNFQEDNIKNGNNPILMKIDLNSVINYIKYSYVYYLDLCS